MAKGTIWVPSYPIICYPLFSLDFLETRQMFPGLGLGRCSMPDSSLVLVHRCWRSSSLSCDVLGCEVPESTISH